MSNFEKLEQARLKLAWALQQQEEAEAEYKSARETYIKDFEAKLEAYEKQLKSENPDVVEAYEKAMERSTNQRAAVGNLRDEVKQHLTNWQQYEDMNNDKKPLPGLARRDSVKPIILNERELFLQLVDRAPHLLKIDEKALEGFVKSIAITGKDAESSERDVMLPENVRALLPALEVEMDYTWTISEKTIIKDAPDEEPVGEIDALETQEVDPVDDAPDYAIDKEVDDIPF
jgi:ribosomal protein S20